MGIESYKAVRNTVDIVILAAENTAENNIRKVPSKKLQVMLIKRDSEPFNNTWTLPGGFVDYEESLQECVDKKLKQKTGLMEVYTEQLYTYGDNIKRDPRDRVITIAYIALVNKPKIRYSADTDKETAWFWVNQVRDASGNLIEIELTHTLTDETITELGFDHKSIIIDALRRMENKIMYTDIGFNLVGDEFTIKELEMAYEVVIGKHIPGFRRIIESKLEETGKTTTDVRDKPDSYRPAKLYKRKI